VIFLDNKQSHRNKNIKTNSVALANLKSPVFSSKMPHPSYQLASNPVAFADLKSPPPPPPKKKRKKKVFIPTAPSKRQIQ